MPEAREVAAALRTRAKLADVSQHQRSRRSTLDTPSGKGTQVDLLPEFKSLKRERPLQRIAALTSLKGREPASHLSFFTDLIGTNRVAFRAAGALVLDGDIPTFK